MRLLSCRELLRHIYSIPTTLGRFTLSLIEKIGDMQTPLLRSQQARAILKTASVNVVRHIGSLNLRIEAIRAFASAVLAYLEDASTDPPSTSR